MISAEELCVCMCVSIYVCKRVCWYEKEREREKLKLAGQPVFNTILGVECAVEAQQACPSLSVCVCVCVCV